MNVGNIKRAAQHIKIEDPLLLSLKQLHARLKECKEHTKRLMAESPWMRRQFLLAKKQDAIDKKDEAEAQRIQQILQGEGFNERNSKASTELPSATEPGRSLDWRWRSLTAQ